MDKKINISGYDYGTQKTVDGYICFLWTLYKAKKQKQNKLMKVQIDRNIKDTILLISINLDIHESEINEERIDIYVKNTYGLEG